MKRLILLAVGFGLLAATDRYQAERERMVRDQIEARGIRVGWKFYKLSVQLSATSSFPSYFAQSCSN
jgi:hypothetical protein